MGFLETPELVAEIRRVARLTQEQLAQRMAVSFATVNAWERGRSAPRAFHRAALDRVAASFGILQGIGTLVIEDEEDAAMLIQALLEHRDETFNTTWASSGTDGLLVCGAMQPDLLFLDIAMPGGIDGFEVAEALSRVDGLERTQVVFVTGQTDPRTLEMARRVGCGEVLCKPYSPSQFHACVDRVLARLAQVSGGLEVTVG